MINNNFIVHFIFDKALGFKKQIIYIYGCLCTYNKFIFKNNYIIGSLKQSITSSYKYKLNIIFYSFLLSTLYHFFYLSLTHQNILCLIYLTLGSFLYLLVSGFIYFIKLYQYNRFTGFIQDFWRLSLTVFWLIEGSLLVVILFVLSLGPVLPYSFYKTESKLGSEYIQYISFESFIVKHLPLLLIVVFTSKDDDEQTTFESTISALLLSIIITWVLLDEFYLLFHITNVYFKETPSYLWGSQKWSMSHSTLWRTKMWVSYFGLCTFTKFLHIIFSAYFVLFWLTATLKEGGASSEVDNLEEASDENIKAAANFNLVSLYIWLSYMIFYPMLNKTIFVVVYNNNSVSYYFSILYGFIKEIVLYFLVILY